jgi:hypothetical protein
LPKISEFFGIVVYMYWFDDKRHKVPHIHAIYGGEKAVFDLGGNCIAGNLGKRASKLVQEFVRERETELRAAWSKAIKGEDVPWIKPIS